MLLNFYFRCFRTEHAISTRKLHSVCCGSFHKSHRHLICNAAICQLKSQSLKNSSYRNGIKAASRVFGKFPLFLSSSIFSLGENGEISAIDFVSFFYRNEYSHLAQQYQPLNLGQGFSDYPVPKYITDALAATASGPNPLLNQYTRGFVSEIFYEFWR